MVTVNVVRRLLLDSVHLHRFDFSVSYYFSIRQQLSIYVRSTMARVSTDAASNFSFIG
jgi:hypothetical protein